MSTGTAFYLSPAAGQALVDIAHRSLVCFVRDREINLPLLADCMPELQAPGASFVTLTNQGMLRGCIGSVEAKRPLALDVAHNSVAAASRDPRFVPLQPAELPSVRLSVTVLTTPEPLIYQDYFDLTARLRPEIDGVILTYNERRGLLLPQVWARISDPAEFLDGICEKAGIDHGLLHQSPPLISVYVFQALHFHEPGYLEPGGGPPAHS